MKYRIVLHEDGFYRVQYRSWWYWWITDSYYEVYDTPQEITDYGGLLGNIGYKRTSYGRRSEIHFSRESAERQIGELKSRERQRREKEPKNRKVVYTDP